MTPERLCDRMLKMPLGGVEVLSKDHFDAVFAREATLEARKSAAATLARRCGCEVLFVGADNIYVRFTRH